MKLKLDRARQIQGWMTDTELKWLAEQASTHGRIVEVGSWKGRSTSALAENTPGMVFSVDTWQGSAELTKEQIGPEGWLYQQFLDNTRGLPIISVKMSSVDAADYFAKICWQFFDMIFIDASHDYENVKADILAWRHLLQPGGILCGHDFMDWEGVTKAVSETLGLVKLPAGSIWLKEGEADVEHLSGSA